MSRTEQSPVTPLAAAGLRQQLRRHTAAWYWAARPFTLSAAVVPVLVGSALAFRQDKADAVLFVLMLLGSLLVQVTANLVDEYSDDARPEGKNKLLAPYKVIASGRLSRTAVKWGALVSFALATAIGLYLVSVAGWPVLAICLGGAAAAYFYAAGPRPLGTLDLGHPLVFVFMGPAMVIGAYFVQTRAFDIQALWLSLPVGFAVTGILAANDLRDMEEDSHAGKTTPVTLLGRGFGRLEWALLIAAAFVVVLVLAVSSLGLTVLLTLLALPQGWKTLRVILNGKDRAGLAPSLPSTSRLHLHLGLLLAVGVALGRFITL